MIVKRLLCPERQRRIPARFSWVDQRLVREHHIERCEPDALALYLLLVTVGDAQGLSYYADATAARLISIHEDALCQARQQLLGAGLIAYHKPLYQVLDLEPALLPPPSPRADRCVSLGQILGGAMGGAQ